MFLIMSYTHNKVVSALNVNEAYTESHLQEGCFGSLVCSIGRNNRVWPPQLLLIPQSQPCSCFKSQAGKPRWSTRVFQPLGSTEGRLCYMALPDQHGFSWISPPFSQSQPPSASPISARGYYSSLVQLHTLGTFYFQAFDLRPRLEHSHNLVLMEMGWKMVMDGEAEERQKCTAGGEAVS